MVIQYFLSFSLTAHLIHVKLSLTTAKKNQAFIMAAWVPGSYLIRDFSKHIVNIRAYENGHAITVAQIDKQTWIVDNQSSQIELHYDLFAFDGSPRGAYVDSNYIFFDGARIFMQVEGQLQTSCFVVIERPIEDHTKNWLLATSMNEDKIDKQGFGRYLSSDYFDAIDHPVVLGHLEMYQYEVNQTPHYLAVIGKHYGDMPTLLRAMKIICQQQIAFFGALPKMRKYLFILRVSKSGYGGIEHRSACSLLVARNSLPDSSECQNEEYNNLLGLISHEYFHLWNVKRLRPSVFIKPQLTDIQYTKQLWIFEGITSYYDELMLIKSGLVSKMQYFQWLGKNISLYLQSPGREKQTLAEASFNAWIKFYQPDCNSPNANVSYYLNGALVAMALDITIMQQTSGNKTLQDVMQAIWQEVGVTEKGLQEDEFEIYASKVSGLQLTDFFERYVRHTILLPFEQILETVGLELIPNEIDPILSFGIKLDPKSFRVISVLNNSMAEKIGIAPDDELMAIDQLKMDVPQCQQVLNQSRKLIDIHVFRDDHLLCLSCNLEEYKMVSNSYTIKEKDSPTDAQKILQARWLGQDNTMSH